jgi:hypothetical protein
MEDVIEGMNFQRIFKTALNSIAQLITLPWFSTELITFSVPLKPFFKIHFKPEDNLILLHCLISPPQSSNRLSIVSTLTTISLHGVEIKQLISLELL